MEGEINSQSPSMNSFHHFVSIVHLIPYVRYRKITCENIFLPFSFSMTKKYYVMYCIRKNIRILGHGPNRLVTYRNESEFTFFFIIKLIFDRQKYYVWFGLIHTYVGDFCFVAYNSKNYSSTNGRRLVHNNDKNNT